MRNTYCAGGGKNSDFMVEGMSAGGLSETTRPFTMEAIN
jgi:hypothetical protein